jgi:hypothetical protein
MKESGTETSAPRPPSLSDVEREGLRELATVVQKEARAHDLAELLTRLERLADERDALERMQTAGMEPILDRLQYEKGALNIWLRHPVVQFLVLQMTSMFAAEKVENYLESTLTWNGVGYLVLIRKLPEGKTPAQLAAEAREEADALRVENQRLRLEALPKPEMRT